MMFVNVGIEEAFATAFRFLAIALVFSDVGNEAIIEADFTSGTRVKRTVGVEIGTSDIQSEPLHGFAGVL